MLCKCLSANAFWVLALHLDKRGMEERRTPIHQIQRTMTMSDTGIQNEPRSDRHTATAGASRPGMDRIIEKKTWTPRRVILLVVSVLLVGITGVMLWITPDGTSFRVQAERLTVSTASTGEFQESISVTGTLRPVRTVFLDAVEGGRVEQIYAEEGAMMQAGAPILQLVNNNLQLDLLNREAQFYETMNYLREARLSMEQNTLNLRQQLLDINYQITRLQRLHDRNEVLFTKQLISNEAFEEVKDELDYQTKSRELTVVSHQQDSLMRLVQIAQLEASVTRMQQNLEVVRQNLDNLVVRAPIAGQLTSLNAEIGESIANGQRLGQVDRLDGFIVNAPVDQLYLPRVQTGLSGRFVLSDEVHGLEVNKVYPEVREGRFEVDMSFLDDPPDGVRRGQTLRMRLELGNASTALLIPRGGFFNSTGGSWVYVIEGSQAVRQPIVLGRQNPDYFEVLEGLQAGDQVITSSYDTYGDAEKLVIQN